MAKTRRRRNVHKRKTKKHHRRHRTKRRVKRRRKTTRKKRGRGISPSKMAKGAVAALAASEMMKQGSAAVSPQGRDIQRQLRSADCTTIKEQGRHLIKDSHPDKGGSVEDFRAVYGTLTHRRGQCNLRQGRGDSKPKPKKKPGESAKRARQRENRENRERRAKEREEQAKAKARTQRQQEADARAGRRQQENTESTGTNYMRNIGVGAAAVGAAGLVAREMKRGRQRVRNTTIVTRNDGRRELVRINDGLAGPAGSVVRELTPERR